jgi:glutamate racemase
MSKTNKISRRFRVAVFDSGVGGKSVANAIKSTLENVDVLLVADEQNLPYGNKPPELLYELVEPILQMLATEVDVIVIACNTVSTVLVGKLREVIDVPIVALEPMVKPAAKLTNSGKIAVCATPTTLNSNRYAELKKLYASEVTVYEPDCSDWAYMIQNGQVEEQKISERIAGSFS